MTLNKIIAGAVALTSTVALATAASAAGSVNATAPATATIVSPVTLTKTQNMAFGSIVRPSNANTNTVTLDANGNVTLSGTGNATLVVSTRTSALFNVVGVAGTTYTTTQGLVFAPTLSNTAAALPVASTGTLGTIPAGGSQELRYGASFDITSATLAQAYTGTLSVQLDYN